MLISKKILHIATLDKFIPDFIYLLRKYFSEQSHTVLTYGDIKKHPYSQSNDTIHFGTLKNIRALCKLLISLHVNDKVILHGLFYHQLTILLCFLPWLHKKCFWVIWGGDLYYHQQGVTNSNFRLFEFFRKRLISRLGGFITYVDGDYYNAQQWYGAKGILCEAITYKSNVYSGGELFQFSTNSNVNGKGGVNLLVGNSADVTNNHRLIFEEVAKLDVSIVDKIYCPLSYGDSVYAESIRQLGYSIFGAKFFPLMDFIPLVQYNKILDEVDIAIFAHNRQQAMGNTINLLGRGKTVFMRVDTSSYALLTRLGIKVFPFDKLDLKTQSVEVAINNNKVVSNYFSEENLVNQLKLIFS